MSTNKRNAGHNGTLQFIECDMAPSVRRTACDIVYSELGSPLDGVADRVCTQMRNALGGWWFCTCVRRGHIDWSLSFPCECGTLFHAITPNEFTIVIGKPRSDM
ncbi:MAG: hypothetical protein WC732_08700 [Candidatus Omnitrophota bacterium]